QTEVVEQQTLTSAEMEAAAERVSVRGEARGNAVLIPQAGTSGCSCQNTAKAAANGNGAVEYPYVYALGRIEARFPRLSVEKEFAQAAGRTDVAGNTDQQLLHSMLSQREHRYLARQMGWVLTVQGLETYLLVPRDPVDLDRFIEAIRPVPSPLD